MKERQTSIADSLIAASAPLDGRYRLDLLVRRSATATIHVATHRNGSTAWLKLPVAANFGALLAREASIANTIGSPLLVRDDGTTPDRIPYLVIDPPEGDSLGTLRVKTRARGGTRLPLARVMTIGDALARVVASLHAMSYVTAGLHEDDVFVFANGEVALLDLHAIEATSAEGVLADVKHVKRILALLVKDVAEPAPEAARAAQAARAAIDAALAADYPDVGALQLAWRAAAPEKIETPVRIRPGSFADFPSSGRLVVAPRSGAGQHATPLAMSVSRELAEEQPSAHAAGPEGSIIGYLRSGGVRSVPPAADGSDVVVLDDPLSRAREMPRLVHAASHGRQPETRAPKRGVLLGAALALAAAAIALGAGVFVLSPGGAERGSLEQHAALEAKPAPVVAAAPVTAAPRPSPSSAPEPFPSAAPEPSPSAAPSEDDLQLTTMLSTEAAPPNRDVFIDGKTVGTTPLEVSVPCGRHLLQMVAGAPKQDVELPCGGHSVVRYDKQGHWSLHSK